MLIHCFLTSFKRNRVVLIALLTFVSVISACTSVGDRNNGESKEFDTAVTLIAATNRDTYSQTDPITVTATVIVLDIDGNKITLDRGGDTPLARYQMVVLDKQGELVPQTAEGFRLVAAGRHHMSYPVDQNSPDQESFRVDTWFDLSRPGTYTLVLSWTLSI